MRREKRPPKLALTAVFAIVVFVILLVTVSIVGFGMLGLIKIGIVSAPKHPSFWFIIFTFAIASIIVGTAVAVVFSNIPLRPINKLISGMNRLASGKYDTRINLGNAKFSKDLEDSFNTLASELEKTEMLRSDFVNNFSHEFKTPLVSIRGFAKLLEKGTLSEEKQKKYLGIIVSESTRLADMATKVLNLTKLENQEILTDIEKFNLSEQIRESVLLLEKKWEAKNLSFLAAFDEFYIEGNEEMLKHVWINLLDNAIKFSEEGRDVDIHISTDDSFTKVAITNQGPEIPKAEQERIFRKFYQSDTSHTASGNGIGLALVKRITCLHQGTVQVQSGNGETTFTVTLPPQQ